jgi:thymidylate synthase (FAD)|tara:strand:+ start:416 stop:1042 length:627 start_codon:yes stop_codon:yes gene_type:complete
MKVELIDSMGTDLTVVNAARVSFGKKKEKFEEGDEKLIRYLAKHNHWSPFGHCTLQFHIKAPVFVARQLVKHQVGLVWNEISRRYVDVEPEFYEVDKWRGKPVDKKQGSDGEIEQQGSCSYSKQMVENNARIAYNDLLNAGVAPEQARMVLPQSLMTEWYWSGSLYAFARVCNLRCAEDSQYETRLIANEIDKQCHLKFPISWTELRK